MKMITINSKQEIYRLLNITSESKFSHGQIRRVASYVIRNYGHEWAIHKHELTREEKVNRVLFRSDLKKIIKNSVKDWHSNEYSVWVRFSNHAKNIASRIESIKLIKKIKNGQ